MHTYCPTIESASLGYGLHPLHVPEMVKTAITVERGDPVTGSLAKALAWVNPIAYIMPGTFDPIITKKNKDREEMEKLLKELEDSVEDDLDKEVLKQIKVRTAGPNPIDDLIYENAPDRPWYKRIGGRVWRTPYSIPHRLLNTIVYPFTYLASPILGPHYNSATRTINMAGRSPAVLTHELGHALEVGRELERTRDYNIVAKALAQGTPAFYRQAMLLPYLDKEETPSIPVSGAALATARSVSDASGFLRNLVGPAVPIATPGLVGREYTANELSLQLLGHAVATGNLDKKKARKLIRSRYEYLYPGMASYIATALPPEIRGPASLFGSIAAKLSGKYNANTLTDKEIDAVLEHSAKRYKTLLKRFKGEPEQNEDQGDRSEESSKEQEDDKQRSEE